MLDNKKIYKIKKIYKNKQRIYNSNYKINNK